ncbi:MAG: ABC transporter substrate-binding protein [Bradyrhizobium sp.]
MNRRGFLGWLGSALSIASSGAAAQPTKRVFRIGGLHSAPISAPHHVAFMERLRNLGYVDGENLIVDRDGYGLRYDQFANHAEELVARGVDVLLCAGDVAIRAAQRASSTIPILGMTDDMVGSGLVRSLASPGGNVTGVSILASDLDGKRQQILMEVVPSARRIGALSDSNTNRPLELDAVKSIARVNGVSLTIYAVRDFGEVGAAIESMKSAGEEAINVLASPLFFNNAQPVIAAVAQVRLPAIYQWSEMAARGGLVAYGPSIVISYRDQMAPLLIKLLQGVKPSDLPIEQPTKFEFVVNMKTAAALGLTIPAIVQMRADSIIE